MDVEANQRVVVDAYKGVRKTVAWPRGEQLKELPRFHAGIASAEVVVEKVGGRVCRFDGAGQLRRFRAPHLVFHGRGEDGNQWRARQRLGRSDGPAQADRPIINSAPPGRAEFTLPTPR